MTDYLLDTNIVSELSKEVPEPLVLDFLSTRQNVWVPVILIYEVEFGLRKLPPGRRRASLSALMSSILESFANRIIPLDRAAAEWAAEFSVQDLRAGRSTGTEDCLIAGIAKAHDLAVVTRNTRDFELFDVEVINPWGAE